MTHQHLTNHDTDTFRVTIHTGEEAEIRPLRPEDLPVTWRPEAPIDPRWQALRWLSPDETAAPGYDCVAWLDRGRLFLPGDGQGGPHAFDERGPQTEYVAGRAGPDGTIVEPARINGRWYDAATGERATPRTSAPLWSHRTGTLGPGNIELRPVVER